MSKPVTREWRRHQRHKRLARPAPLEGLAVQVPAERDGQRHGRGIAVLRLPVEAAQADLGEVAIDAWIDRVRVPRGALLGLLELQSIALKGQLPDEHLV
jgi:hypothetical protein